MPRISVTANDDPGASRIGAKTDFLPIHMLAGKSFGRATTMTDIQPLLCDAAHDRQKDVPHQPAHGISKSATGTHHYNLRLRLCLACARAVDTIYETLMLHRNGATQEVDTNAADMPKLPGTI